MATQGPNSGSNFSSLGLGPFTNSTNWTNPSNVGASDDSYATNDFATDGNAKYLLATGFGFSVPSGATITGIVVETERKVNTGSANDAEVKLTKNGKVIARKPGFNHFNAKQSRTTQLAGRKGATFTIKNKPKSHLLPFS